MKKYRFAIGIAVVLIAIAYFAFAGYNEGKAYYKTIDEVAALQGKDASKRLRVAGLVKDGSIERNGKELRFVLAHDLDTTEDVMIVNYVGSSPVPDTFKDRAEAIVEGKRMPDGTFEADHIQAKCASKYEAKYGAAAQHPQGVDPRGGAHADSSAAGSY